MSVNVGESLGTPTRRTPLMDMDNPASYSKFVGATSDFAISPKAKSDVRADAMRLETRPHSWVGIVIRARDYLRDRN